MTPFSLFQKKPVLLGVVHLPALPGAPHYSGNLSHARGALRRDLLALHRGGAHAIIIENFGDTPFPQGSASPATVAALTSLATEVRDLFPGPLGINLLRNDGVGAMAIAHAVLRGDHDVVFVLDPGNAILCPLISTRNRCSGQSPAP